MKRNSIFMWAYISFIMISALFRVFNEFSLWKPIVLAITVSSIFFALEDLFASRCRSLMEFSNILNTFLLEARKKYNANMELVAKMDDKILMLKDSHYNLTDTISLFQAMKEQLHELNESFCSRQRENEEREIRLKQYEKMEILWTYLGFLCLFCTLIVATKFTISNTAQEILTAITFAVILTTHQLDDIWMEKNRMILDKSRRALEDHATVSKGIEKIGREFDEVVIQITYEEQKQKEEHNAN